MNICVDIRPLMGGKITGVEVYTLNLLANLLKLDHKNNYILFANAEKDQSRYLPIFKQDNVTTIQTKIPNKILNMSLALLHKPKLDRLILKYLQKHPAKQPGNFKLNQGIDIFFMPDLRPSALSKNVKKITVVHDLSFEHFPEFFSIRTRLWYKLLNVKKELRTSNNIIAVSNFTKEDLIQTYHIAGEKITVIHEAVTEDFALETKENQIQKVRKKYGLPEEYFLTLSTLEPRKNLGGLLKAFKKFKEKQPNSRIKLVLAGIKNSRIFSAIKLQHATKSEANAPTPTKQAGFTEQNTLSDIILTGFIEEEDKAVVYEQATAFLYVSLYEGFGLPLVEAMKCQTPIIASRTSAIPEVTGNAALLINPCDTYAMTEAMIKIQNPEVQIQLKKAMQEQIKKFSWEKCAKETLLVMRSKGL